MQTKQDVGNDLGPETRRFYLHVLDVLEAAAVPCLVGGAYALACYTGIVRHTKDFDIFVRPGDCQRALDALAAQGYSTELTFSHWLGKALHGDDVVDLIFSSGNGVVEVDDAWFEHAVDSEVLGRPARLCPAEEIIWSKAFVMERERYDGADIAHLIRARASDLDWTRLLRRFDRHWRLLLVYLILFGYTYPAERSRIPAWVLQELFVRFQQEPCSAAVADPVCQGTLLSRAQYLVDVESWGYRDARLEPSGTMSPEAIAHWTAGIAIDGPDAH
ncbi:MAG: nucleotidyltransferase family protein [Gemmataceae bacterium]|nr:nucleotidyltransferase family protein [Gemmataceae bacterium]